MKRRCRGGVPKVYPWVRSKQPVSRLARLAAQMDGKGQVAVCFFGDGASNAGPFHESINIAAKW